jgi:hypothetical protein
MTSNINPTVPVGTQALSADLRGNLQAAHDEIEALQTGKLDLAGGTMTGALVLWGNPVTPNDASDKAYVDASIADLNDVYMRWVPYTGPPQSFLAQDLTRDGDWTMVANKNTSDRPAPQPSGNETDLLQNWTPTQQNIRATFTVRNQWTLNASGWIDQYGVDVNPQNAGAVHAISLMVNGVTRDSLTTTPSVSGMLWENITPLLVLSGAVIQVMVQVTQIGNQLMYYDQQLNLFTTPPTYCSLAQGSMNAGAWGTTAYDCHVMFIPGAASPDWDVVAYGGAGAGGGGIEEAPLDGAAYGRQTAAWVPVVPTVGATLTNAANDAAAATAGVPLNGVYRNGSALMIRIT